MQQVIVHEIRRSACVFVRILQAWIDVAQRYRDTDKGSWTDTSGHTFCAVCASIIIECLPERPLWLRGMHMVQTRMHSPVKPHACEHHVVVSVFKKVPHQRDPRQGGLPSRPCRARWREEHTVSSTHSECRLDLGCRVVCACAMLFRFSNPLRHAFGLFVGCYQRLDQFIVVLIRTTIPRHLCYFSSMGGYARQADHGCRAFFACKWLLLLAFFLAVCLLNWERPCSDMERLKTHCRFVSRSIIPEDLLSVCNLM
jgi:hypothetical protein